MFSLVTIQISTLVYTTLIKFKGYNMQDLRDQTNPVSHNIKKGIMIYSNEITKNNAKEIVKKLYNLRFTDIFFIAKNIDGKVFYLSKYAETVEDKLSLLCEIASIYNINVYAWFCTFTEGYDGKLFGNGISQFLRENPDCAAIDRNGKNTLEKPVFCDQGLENYVCPANQKVQKYELKLMREIVQNYPIKGIHLDFIRYPFPGNYCYCDFCHQNFEKEFGISIESEESKRYVLKWRQNTITNFVNKIHREIKKLNKNIKTSALVWKYDDCLEKTQDWKEWNIDFVTPMFYHKSYRKKIKWIKDEIDRNKQVSNKNIVGAVGGPYSNLFMKKEWKTINKTINSSEANGLLYGHYGLLDVIQTLEGSGIADVKKIIAWSVVRCINKIRGILVRIIPNAIKIQLRNRRKR